MSVRAAGHGHPPLRHRLHQEDGNALIEFVVLSAALLIPSLYLVLTLGNVQAAVFAADTISRDVARIHAVETDPDRAAQRAAEHSAMVLEDHGLPAGQVWELSCTKNPCATPGGIVTAQVRIAVKILGRLHRRRGDSFALQQHHHLFWYHPSFPACQSSGLSDPC